MFELYCMYWVFCLNTEHWTLNTEHCILNTNWVTWVEIKGEWGGADTSLTGDDDDGDNAAGDDDEEEDDYDGDDAGDDDKHEHGEHIKMVRKGRH